MRTPVIILRACMVAFAAFAGTVNADEGKTIYVDDDNLGKSGLTGRSAALAYGTIQDAVDAAASGDTILVLPGDYDAGGKEFNGYMNRVCVDREGVKLTIRSTGGRSVTRIIGAKDPDGNAVGVGPDAVRPVLVWSEDLEAPVVFEGFTITGGACHGLEVNLNNYGGAVYSLRKNAYLVDCEIAGNGGSRGIVFRATCVRCFIHDNDLLSGKGTMAWQSDLLHCVGTRNTDGSAVCEGRAVNCTIEDIKGDAGRERSVFLNCLLMGVNGDVSGRDGVVYTNCVADLSANTTSGLSFGDASSGNKGDASRFQTVAPLLDDYRLLATSDAVGFADASLIASVRLPEEIDPYLDFYGNAIPASGSVAAGACQATVTPAGGAMLFTEPVRILGTASKSFAKNGYAFAVEYPVQWHVQPELEAGQYVYNYTIAGATGNGKRVPDLDEKFWVMPPPAGIVATNKIQLTEFAYWVNPTTGRDEPEGDEVRGTEENPFRTLQKAVTAAQTMIGKKTVGAVVFAAEGTYAEGGAWEAHCSNRVSFAKHLRLKGAGAGKSIIKGQLDDASDDHGPDGRGNAAMRCAYVSGGAIQGFTLDEGRCVWKGGSTASYTGTYAGGVYGMNTPVIADCIITNCSAVRGGSVFQTSLFRTRITDCHLDGAKNATLYGCILDAPVDCKLVGSDSKTYQCTGLGNAEHCAWGSDWITAINSIVSGGPSLINKHVHNWHGCCIDGFSSYDCETGDNVVSDPQFVGVSAGDYRVLSSSAAQTCGVFPEDYWTYYSSDFNGNPVFFADGKPMAGALQIPVSAVIVQAPGAAGGISCAGTNVVDSGASLTVSVVDGTRHAVDISVNGSPVGATQWTYHPPAAGQAGAVTVEAVFSTNWYVNADAEIGNDGNDGFTPLTPFRTLAKALSNPALLAGDCVHAAAGVYDDGDMEQKYYGNNDQRTTRVRACVDEGITLVGEGAETTVIKGNREASENAPFGTEPLRCLNLTHGATVIGFTLTDGSAAWAERSGQNEPYLGGGVIAPVATSSSRLPLVKDCVISNCHACRGGGAFGGAFVNCKFIGNYSTEDGNATFLSRMEGCLIDLNTGKSDGCSLIRYPYGMRNLTITARNISADTGRPSKHFIYDYNEHKKGLYNSIVMGGVDSVDSRSAIAAVNCIFASDCENPYDPSANGSVGCSGMPIADMACGPDGRPGRESPAVDAADTATMSVLLGGCDVEGAQRVYNGVPDIGCFEYDWRADFAKAMGGRVSVTKVSPGAVLQDGAVVLSDGDVLEGRWPATSGRADYAVPAVVDGSGILTAAFVNANAGYAQTAEFVSDSPAYTFTLGGTELDCTFAYSGDGNARLSGFACNVHGLTIFIK